jgi:hypothetical protein
MAVQVVPVTPYDKSGFLLPILLKRIIDFNQQHFTIENPETIARAINMRLAAGDPNVLLLAGVGAKADVVGHAVGTLEEDPVGRNRWVFCWQCRVDPGEGSSDPTLVTRFLEAADEWGHQRGATHLRMSTPRNDAAWQRKYGFEFERCSMFREIGSPIPAKKPA